jgi:hypothetical protein
MLYRPNPLSPLKVYSWVNMVNERLTSQLAEALGGSD